MQIAELEYLLEDSIPTQRTLRLRIGASDVRLAMDRAAAKLQGEVTAPGFRKGHAPLALIRKNHAARVEADAFSSLKHDALEQVFAKLGEKDKPFTPPEVLDQRNIKLRYNRPLEFAVKYLVDPAGLSRQPEHPSAQQGATLPGAQLQHPILHGMGIPTGPKLPAVPMAPSTSPPPMSAPVGEPASPVALPSEPASPDLEER
jgi:hypothetical protein